MQLTGLLLFALATFLQSAHAGFGVGPVVPGGEKGFEHSCPQNETLVLSFKDDNMILFECQKLRSICGTKLRPGAMKADTSCISSKSSKAKNTLKYMTDFQQKTPSNSPSSKCVEIERAPENLRSEKCKKFELKLNPKLKVDTLNAQLKQHESRPLPKTTREFGLGLFRTGKLEFKSQIKHMLRSIKLTKSGTYVIESCTLLCERRRKDKKEDDEVRRAKKNGASLSLTREEAGKLYAISPEQYEAYKLQEARGREFLANEGLAALYLALQNGECFSNDQLVQTPTGPRRMDSLKIGDLVEVMSEEGRTFEQIQSFAHFDTKTSSANYHRITTEGGNEITISSKHLIYLKSKCRESEKFNAFQKLDKVTELKFDFAEKAKPGQCLLVWNTTRNAYNFDQISQTEQIVAQGLIAPMTPSGSIIVNDILASCYSNYKNQGALNEVFTSKRMLAKWFSDVFGWSLDLGLESPTTLAFLRTLGSYVFPLSMY